MRPPMPIWIQIMFAAWVLTGVYFIISKFRAHKIASKEPGATRMGDRLLIWGGYGLIFVDPLAVLGWSARFVMPGWRELVGVIGMVLAVGGLAFTCWARAALGQYWSGIVALKQDHQLVQSGPSAAIRHPLYTGLLAATLGSALAVGMWRNLLGAALLWTAFL